MPEKIYGLIGGTLRHSWSVPIHKSLGCEDYRLIELEPSELGAFLRGGNIGGLNVTIPYKRTVMQYCDIVDPEAAEIGSVNTITTDPDGRLHAYNTDCWGFEYMLRRAGFDPAGKHAVIMGSGGTSLTAQYVLRKLGVEKISVISRKGSSSYSTLPDGHLDAGIIVNATPVGMYPDNGSFLTDPACYPALEFAADVIYNPLRTEYLLRAQKCGVPCSNGLPMLVAQAFRSEELFRGEKLDPSNIEKITARLRKEFSNIVLIGMPGAGKSTVGGILASMTGRELIDLDDRIASKAGMTIPEIFSEYGEKGFRDRESEAAREAGKLTGKIIVAGGGIVENECNLASLRQNGRIYEIRRPIELLPTEGRPVSISVGVRKLSERREPLYKKFRDAEADNSRTPEEAARQILEDFNENTCD
ncbi:MAG: shikimate kinase [Oscillospiraceae bacterium]|jgi:shikimate dehydrogenase